MKALSVYTGAFWALTVCLGIFVFIPALLSGHNSLRDIGTPCRDHGGVAQYVPESLGIETHELATVVCKDGEVGRVG